MHNQRKLLLYISMSLDGFISTKDNDVSWLSIVEKENEDYGYQAFTETVDTYIVGRTTYETILTLTGGKFPASSMFDCYVITRQERENENNVTFYNGNVETLVKELKSKEGKHIYCDGGSEIVRLLMQKDLIDTYLISVIPIILGDGKRLFLGDTPTIPLEAETIKQYDTGLIQLQYNRKV